MEKRENRVSMVSMLPQHNKNPLELIHSDFDAWLSKQSLPVAAAVDTVGTAAVGALIRPLWGFLKSDGSLRTPSTGVTFLLPELYGGPWMQARNFALYAGASAGIGCVMSRLRGKYVTESSMVAGFCSGALFSLVSGFGCPNQAQNALTSGLYYALFQGGLVKLREKFHKVASADNDLNYSKTRSMLSNLGLDQYEKNFKNGLLTDYTLPLLTERAICEVRIPPGPRLLIMDHIHRSD